MGSILNYGKNKIKLSAECLSLSRWPWLDLGRREIFYDDIDQIEFINGNGHGREDNPFLTLRLKDSSEYRLGFSTENEALRLRADLEEIIRPAIIREESALDFETIVRIALDLAASPGPNIRKMADFLIAQGLAHQASDLNLEFSDEGLKVNYKIDGVMFPLAIFDPALGARLINCLKVASGLILYRRDIIQEGRMPVGFGPNPRDLRVSVIPSHGGERLAIRMFDKLKGGSNLDDLGFDPEISKALDDISRTPHGLFLICGPSGSGKTTTLYALLRHISRISGRLAGIIALEDPIEHRLANITQIQVDPKGDMNFAHTLASVLRQDPGVIMVGEIRDAATAEAVIRAALTGHLVLSTVHCATAAESVTRLLDLGVSPVLLNSCLKGALCQRLVRQVCPSCGGGEKDDPPPEPDGCPACRNTGYKGRTVIAEFWQNNEKIGQLIEQKAKTGAIEDRAVESGMITLARRGRTMVESGLTDSREIKRILGSWP